MKYSFAYKVITPRSIPINVSLIDTTIYKMQNGTDQYISKIITDVLEPKERINMALDYRKFKELFAEQHAIKSINEKLATKKGDISEKDFTISIDISSKTNWESILSSYLDEVPFQFAGKGEQNTIKMKLALEARAHKAHLILIEEPENHLSFSSMNKLIDQIKKKCIGKQLIITTHSTFVLNKLGLEKVILFKNGKSMTLNNLNSGTQNYFMKLPGYDTLRMLLAKKSILVEGPSDELLVQKAYYQLNNKLPIEDGIDVIAVNSLAFKRFLEIAKKLHLMVNVVTDNDGDVRGLKEKYVDYLGLDTIKICFDEDEDYQTLEPQIVKCNELTTLNKIFKTSYLHKHEMMAYMQKKTNKTNCALKIFESKEKITIPRYINDAIKE
ncbi:ATP-dependent nuclease [Paenibacillus periandrae]|uniref:ATP-dependent nuclease n=1 Tax=Paenibacillus periandrae TaxID=1761741 RepID=UPI001F095596|nr:TOPRIM nucleotidyl transferase/hydrolase domain-containing protein [Paenibacillus periandrae]